MRVSEEDMLDLLMAAAMTISVADAAAVLLLGDEGRLGAAARRYLSDDFPLTESPLDREALSGKPAWGTAGEPGVLLPEGFSHVLYVPLTTAARPLGVLRVYRRADPPFSSTDAERLLAAGRDGDRHNGARGGRGLGASCRYRYRHPAGGYTASL